MQASLLLLLSPAWLRGGPAVRAPAERAPPARAAMPPPLAPTAASNPGATAANQCQLVEGYGMATRLLLDEIAATERGDMIELGIYLLEGGESSESVLAALEQAGGRGVRVHFAIDVSYVSMISRLI